MKNDSINKRITNSTVFIIYGGGEVGNKCYQALHNAGFEVAFGIDRNKSGDDVINGIHTYRLDEAPWKEAMVIICLADGMQHKTAADALHERGYQYIIFLPLEYTVSDREKQVLIRTYNDILAAKLSMMNKRVYAYDKYIYPELDAAKNILIKKHGTFIVWCGIEMLFTESLELWEGDKKKVTGRKKFQDINIGFAPPYINMWEYLDLTSDTCETYFSAWNDKKDWEKEIGKRERLYEIYKREYNKGLTFFIESAPPAVWNPKNYWNLVGGHHRTLFLLHQGHSLFPIEVKRKDFLKWCNTKECDKLINYMKENKVENLYAPFPHPGFLNFPARHEGKGKTALQQVLKICAGMEISHLTALDCLDDEGYFARIMYNAGLKQVVFCNEEEIQLTLAKLCNLVLYRENIQILQKNTLSLNKRYDIIFCKEGEEEQYRQYCSRIMFIERIRDVSEMHDGTEIFQEFFHGRRYEIAAEYMSGSTR